MNINDSTLRRGLTTAANALPVYDTTKVFTSASLSFGEVFAIRNLLSEINTAKHYEGTVEGTAYKLVSLVIPAEDADDTRVAVIPVDTAYSMTDPEEGNVFVWGESRVEDGERAINPLGYIKANNGVVTNSGGIVLESEGAEEGGAAYFLLFPLG